MGSQARRLTIRIVSIVVSSASYPGFVHEENTVDRRTLQSYCRTTGPCSLDYWSGQGQAASWGELLRVPVSPNPLTKEEQAPLGGGTFDYSDRTSLWENSIQVGYSYFSHPCGSTEENLKVLVQLLLLFFIILLCACGY
jgi:hypothetical protein